MNYECHITVPPPALATERAYLEGLARGHRFKTSQIDGDPVLGDKIYFYFTGHDATFEAMKERMERLTEDLAEIAKVKVIRRKIEHVVFDDRLERAVP